ncbi:acyltransferase family protein [Marinococcus halotolerans]|uniref:acyltransferase family protein n=1 Tax=Marinococcus halotolerans TaxID=301092 RepID=UPI0003B5D1DC|nr:acyltransferase family protein [Marinococcus halotolerans]
MNDLRTPEKRFRPEIEGVRAVAAFLVAVYHIWLGSVSGGVDVFFVVSGYLITTSLLSRLEREGTINLPEYLLGLGRRLLPLAVIVILFTMAGSIVFLPQSQWEQIVSEMLASALYFQNWELATSAVDYLAQNNEASPFQHFWALSIQGQFYVLWPLLILLTYFLAKKTFNTPVRKTLCGVLAAVFILSLSYSIYITAANQPWAYFDAFARVWEFSLGGLAALLLPYLTMNKSVGFVLGWLGLAVISLTGLLLPVSTVFPGAAALLPTTGALLIITAAENSSRFGVDKLLGSRPFLYFGSISYGFYLWHWPILIFYFAYFDNTTVSIKGGIAIIVLAFAAAALSVKIIETPLRKINIKQSKGKAVIALVLFLLPALTAAGIWDNYVDKNQSGIGEDYTVTDYPGARAISEDIEPNPDIDPLENVAQAESEMPAFYADSECYSNLEETEISMCSYGDTTDPEYTIALVGGSHSGHWFPALEKMSEELSLQIDVFNKDGCRFSTDDFDGTLSDSCMQWNEDSIEPLKKNDPDLLFTTANVNAGGTIPEGYLEIWEEFEGHTEIFAIRDNPRMQEEIPSCLEESDDPADCAVPRDEVLSENPPWENTEEENIPDNVTFADMSPYFCDDDTCDPVIGNVITFRDNHHISTFYSRTMGPALKEHIEDALEENDE